MIPWSVFSLVWSLGATCDYKSRCIFDKWLRNLQAGAGHSFQFPSEGLVYDYRLHDGGFTDPTDDGELAPPKWYKWLEDIPHFKITSEMPFAGNYFFIVQ